MRWNPKLAVLLVAMGLKLGAPAAAHAQEAEVDTTRVTHAELQRVLEGYGEQITTLTNDIDILKKVKFSGYVQARLETSENSNDSVRVAGNPYAPTSSNLNRYSIRRARLKLAYDSSPLSQAVVYFDGGADRSVRLLEAYVTLLDPWTPMHAHSVTIGQQNVPFGFEVERSSSVRELPERSRAENVLFSGERDRGVKLTDQWTPQLQTTIGVFNGGGINHTDFPNTDPTKAKDFVSRARWSQGWADVAASWYFGRNTTPLTGADVTLDKTRLGFDAQVFYELPRLGGGTVRGEFYDAHEANPDSVRALIDAPTTANPVRLLKPGVDPDHLATDARGGYVMWVQNAGDRAQAVLRYDTWDPNTNVARDQYERWSMGANWFWDGFTRITVSYDAIRTKSRAGSRWVDPKDNLWTLQVQHKF